MIEEWSWTWRFVVLVTVIVVGYEPQRWWWTVLCGGIASALMRHWYVLKP